MAINSGSFIPTTGTWDNSEQSMVALRQNLNAIILALNAKDAGYYSLTEFVNGQLWFPDPALSSRTPQKPTLRPVFRKVINTGALANTGTTTIAHGITITAATTFTRIYGAATDPSTTFIPLPYASPVLAENIALFVDATNVNITTGSDRTGFTTSYVVVEYIQQ